MIVYAGICLYMTVYACIYRTVKLNCSGQYVYMRTRIHIFFWQETLFNAHFSEATLLVVYWPNHDPLVDVEQGASRARGTLTVAHAQRIACFHATHVGGHATHIISEHAYMCLHIPTCMFLYILIHTDTHKHMHIDAHCDIFLYIIAKTELDCLVYTSWYTSIHMLILTYTYIYVQYVNIYTFHT